MNKFTSTNARLSLLAWSEANVQIGIPQQNFARFTLANDSQHRLFHLSLISLQLVLSWTCSYTTADEWNPINCIVS